MKKKTDNLAIMFFTVLLSYLTYVYVMKELPYYLSDYNGHTYVYYPLFSRTHFQEGLHYAPYFMWHAVTFFFHRILLCPLENAAAYSSTPMSVAWSNFSVRFGSTSSLAPR